MSSLLQHAISSVESGRWAIGVSGGADSVALLRLMMTRRDIALHVVHLNHQTRNRASDGDADFVQALARAHRLGNTIALRTDLERDAVRLPANPSARYRQLRQSLFADVVQHHQLNGVLLAHHADDQAETILQRLLRGSGWSGLCGMSGVAQVRGLTICRPLLDIPSSALRISLKSLNQPWREDASNDSGLYQRNRMRHFLRGRPDWIPMLLEIAASAGALRDWTRSRSLTLSESFNSSDLSDQPAILARRSATRWLGERGVPQGELSPQVVDRLLALATDAASPPRMTVPGKILVQRRRGIITASSPVPAFAPAAFAPVASPLPASPPSAALACPSNR